MYANKYKVDSLFLPKIWHVIVINLGTVIDTLPICETDCDLWDLAIDKIDFLSDSSTRQLYSTIDLAHRCQTW